MEEGVKDEQTLVSKRYIPIVCDRKKSNKGTVLQIRIQIFIKNQVL